jgi:hypothetical protein
MIIVAHRVQVKGAPGVEFGIEIDLWPNSACGWVVSHDPPDEDVPTFKEWLVADLNHIGKRPQYWLNIKGDGGPLAAKDLCALLSEADLLDRSYAFDMGYPAQRVLEETGIQVAYHYSESQKPPHSMVKAAWVDHFTANWRITNLIVPPSKIPACFVSPELHGHSDGCVSVFWHKLKELVPPDGRLGFQAALCTQYPYQAQAFFKKQAALASFSLWNI